MTTMDLDNPDTVDVTLMMVGDSISHGSTGDFTWRYRFWKHLRTQGIEVDFLGPKKTLDTVATGQMGDEDFEYADPEFDRDHACQWGLTYANAQKEIGDLVSSYRPDYLLVLLGINDIVWNDVKPDEFEANLRAFIDHTRAARPDSNMIIGTVLDTNRAHDEVDFSRRVFQCNEVIRNVCAELSTEESPIAVADSCREFFAPDHTWDGVHPNGRGELRIAAAFADMLALRFGLGQPYARPLPHVEDINAEFKRNAKAEMHFEAPMGGLYRATPN
ncbi:GDSL-type esterase/lipase family protein [Streptacidiphilus jiangxiensis]|uniref:Lysophospholipase L1 n=1 Tax=Streptacidiphilus jiangxiensis TaxID=235985 RepID=A0A1H7T125_STRJI|nr:GDSL-type esterase/lipase family protein [Streptacidiphilus jiangxiensis]SEL78610.1 Lysophospholipase L1 [Streptacidiphilus jiangxiensis]